jgi:hypothetical protein
MCTYDDAGRIALQVRTECGAPHRPEATYPRSFVLNLSR